MKALMAALQLVTFITLAHTTAARAFGVGTFRLRWENLHLQYLTCTPAPPPPLEWWVAGCDQELARVHAIAETFCSRDYPCRLFPIGSYCLGGCNGACTWNLLDDDGDYYWLLLNEPDAVQANLEATDQLESMWYCPGVPGAYSRGYFFDINLWDILRHLLQIGWYENLDQDPMFAAMVASSNLPPNDSRDRVEAWKRRIGKGQRILEIVGNDPRWEIYTYLCMWQCGVEGGPPGDPVAIGFPTHFPEGDAAAAVHDIWWSTRHDPHFNDDTYTPVTPTSWGAVKARFSGGGGSDER